ncbi:MAG: transketolase C-terminal domain-containing protein [Burkholderiaceae bacterium]
MRDTFVKALLGHARADKRVMLVAGDLGFGVLTGFSKELPSQFINAGVAEQNMTGLSTGLALEGRNVFTYSIANFPTLRCLEQIRNDASYHNASVNVVAIGGGFSYGALGMSHHATEDIAIMRALPGLRVFAPCDEHETVAVVAQMIAEPAPTYLRLDKSKVAAGRGEALVPGRLRQLRDGDHVVLVGYGGIVAEILAAADALEGDGIRCAVFSAHTLKPFDGDTLLQLGQRYRAMLTVEEHVSIGGLGSLAADTFLDAGMMPKRFARVCLPDAFSSIVGSQEYLRMRHGIDAQAIVARVRQLMCA